MKVLVWQWGRRGAGPFYAVALARGLGAVPGTQALLSLSSGAELLQGKDPPECALPVATYRSLAGLGLRLLASPIAIPRLVAWLRRERVDIALCAMPAATDLVMAAALRWAKVPYVVVVHDAALHPGDHYPAQIRLQRWLMDSAAAVVALSAHVAGRLRAPKILRSTLPPFDYGTMRPPRAHGGKLRLLSFGRLLPYKGLDLLADTLAELGARADLEVRVVGSGPASAELDRLRAMPNVSVENRWVPEEEVGALLEWADALILTHREASQSGVAAAAITAGRFVVSTNVGGLAEQFAGRKGAVLCEPEASSLADGIRAVLDGRVAWPVQGDDAWPRAVHWLAADLEAALSDQVGPPDRTML